MNFSAWAIRNPIAPLLAFFMLMVLGWQSFNTLPITRFPNIDVPIVSIRVAQPGAAPSEMETQVTKKIEDAVAGITGVKNITSTISDGLSNTAVEFRMEVPTDKAVQDTKDAIDRVLGDLPGEAETPIVSRVDVEGQAIMTFAVSSPNMTLEQLSWFVEDKIKRALQGEAGIGRVDRYGGADREIIVSLDPVKLSSYGVTAAQVSAQLRAVNADLGAGRSELGAQEQTIRVLGDASTAERLAATTIPMGGGRFVRLDQLGTVEDTHAELRSFSRFEGETVVTFGVFRAKGASEVTVANTVNAKLDEMRAANPDVSITKVDDTVTYTRGNYESALHTLMEGAILAVLVVFLFLRNWRATIITALALPLSAVPTFFVMDLLGFSLNLVSFLAITLATGILVDDAIVEIENIARHIRMGKSPYRAAMDAADEIGLAVIATTSTIVAVFVPVSFMPGIPGQYFSQFGLTVAIAVIFSLLVARLITPMLAAYFMSEKDAAEEERRDGWVMRGYVWFVRRTLRLRYLTLLVAFGILVVSVYFMVRIPGSFMPPEDVSRVQISVELPPGSTLDDTRAVTRRMREMIAPVEGVKNVFVLGGASPTGEMDVRRATVTVLLNPLDETLLFRLTEVAQNLPLIGPYLPEPRTDARTRPQSDIEAEIFDKLSVIPDLRAFKLNDRGQRDMTYSILSSNEADLDKAAAALESHLRGDPLLANVSAEGALPRPEVQITPLPDRAARLGVTTRQIAETVRVATLGDVEAALAKVSIDDRQVPVRVRLDTSLRNDLDSIANLKVPTASGGAVPLQAVADISIGQGPNTIERKNRERIVTIGANLPPGVPLGKATARFQELVSQVDLPASVTVAESGDAEVQQELMQSFVNAMIFGLMLVLTVLILLFKSLIQPFTILLSLPLAIGGVAAALILTGSAVSMPVLIGILMLMGIVTKNAILLVDFAIEMRRRGFSRVEAMVEAGHKRARPIIMTSIAMSSGMLPSALGVGAGGTFRAPMATAVIGGIIVSTILSLVVVPSFYLIMDDLQKLLGGMFGRFVGRKEEEPETSSPQELTAALDENRERIDALRKRLDRLEKGKKPPYGGLHVAE